MTSAIGPLELILIALACFLGLAIIAGITALAIYLRRAPRSAPLVGEKCPSCEKNTMPGAPFCPHCGTRLAP